MQREDTSGSFTRILNTITHFMTSISVASVLQSMVIFAFIFTMSHFSIETEYAEYRKTFYVVDFSTAISLFGLGTLILRKPIKSLYDDIVPTMLIINTIQLISVLVFLFIQHLSFVKYLQIVSFIFLETIYQLIVSVIVLKNARRLYFACTSSCFLLTIISLVVLVKFDGLNYLNVYYLRIIILLLYIIPFLIYTGKRIFKIKFPSFPKVVSLFKEAAPIGFGVLLGSCTQYIDKFIASMMDTHQLAVYANASASVPFVGTAITTMSVFFLPIIHKCYINKDKMGACANLSSLFLFGWYLGVSVFTVLFCNAEFVVDLLYSSRYFESVVLFRVFCLGYLFRIVSYTQIIVSLELENIIIKRMFIEMVLQFILSFVLLKFLGVLGLALSVILVLTLWSVPYNVINFKRRLSCKISEILPFKQMFLFFLKAFVPCLIAVVSMNAFAINRTIVFIVSSLLYVVINMKEIIYVIRKTR